MRISWITILFGFILAIGDVVGLSIFKSQAVGLLNKTVGYWIFSVGFLISIIQSFIFYKTMFFEKLVVMNLVWDLTSDILVTLTGVLWFSETLSHTKWIGVFLSVISVLLLNIE